MQHENNRHSQSAADKAAPHNVAGKNEEQAKQKTQPLDANNNQRKDQHEGEMDNGEIGGGLEKKED